MSFVSAYTGPDGNTVVSVSEAFAKSRGLTTLKSDEPLDAHGRPRSPREGNRTKTSDAPKVSASTTPTSGGQSASKS